MAAPLYLSVSRVLTVSYQLFTDTAVKTVASNIAVLSPKAGAWINSNIQTLIFVYAFTWIFVLSSVIPSKILGKERGVLTQYIVVLTLSLIAFFMPSILLSLWNVQADQVLNSVVYFQNIFLAVFYLAVPYLFMIILDLYGRRASRFEKMKQQFIERQKEMRYSQMYRLFGEEEKDGNSESQSKE